MKGRDDHVAAALEAEQEGGLYGRITVAQLGFYDYEKRYGDTTERVRVAVYRLDVEGQHDIWPEHEQRNVQWFRLEEAASQIEETGLAKLFAEIEQLSTTRYV